MITSWRGNSSLIIGPMPFLCKGKKEDIHNLRTVLKMQQTCQAVYHKLFKTFWHISNTNDFDIFPKPLNVNWGFMEF